MATLVLVLAHVPALRAAAPTSKDLLKKLCETHKDEPVCAPDLSLSEDEAWLVLQTACRRDGSEACQAFWQQHGGVLIFDASERSWRAEWERKSWPLKFDLTGTPTLRLNPSSAGSLRIVADDISPMTYSVRPGTPKEEDLSIIADLRAFLGLAGTGLQAVIQASAYSPPSAGGKAFQVPNPELSRERERKIASEPRCNPAPPSVEPVAAAIRARNTKLVQVNEALDAISKQLDALDQAKRGFIAQMQRAEDGNAVRRDDLKDPDTPSLTAAFDRLNGLVRTLEGDEAKLRACQPALSAYATLLSAPANADVLKQLADEVEKAGKTCNVAELAQALTAEGGSVRCAASLPAPPLQDWLTLHGAAMKLFISRLTDVRAAEAGVWDPVKRALASKGEVLAAADMLTRQVTRARLHTWEGTLMRQLVLTRPNPELPWNKIQTHTLIVTATSPYAKDLTPAHPTEESHEFRIESAVGKVLGYGIGIVYTPLHSSTWTAVSAADGTKVIGETKRDSRAGDLAAFLSYRFMEQAPRSRPLRVQPTLDAGVGLTTGRPAFFLGGGVEIARALRLGIGWSPQRVTKLAPGQVETVTVVSGDEDIRTVNRIETKNWYLSLSFALDSLSLFSKQ